MKNHKELSQEVLAVLTRGQVIPQSALKEILENEDTPIYLASVVFNYLKLQASTDWNSFFEGVEQVVARGQDEILDHAIYFGVVEGMCEILESHDPQDQLFVSLLGPITREVVLADAGFQKNPPRAPVRDAVTEDIIFKLRDGQAVSDEEINRIRLKHFLSSDGNLVSAVLRFFMDHADETRWVSLLVGVEELQGKSPFHRDLIQDYILRYFSVCIANGEFDRKKIDRHLGKKSREFIARYDLHWKG